MYGVASGSTDPDAEDEGEISIEKRFPLMTLLEWY
jgi:hypothetical protein